MSSSCCHDQSKDTSSGESCHGEGKRRDYLFIISGLLVLLSLCFALFEPVFLSNSKSLHHFFHSVLSLMKQMWWGLLLGISFLGVLGRIPRELVIAALGRKQGIGGLLRATGLGLMLDLCSHGILFVGAKLYERGATLGQTMAFLIASPWNSLSLTVILISLIGLFWTLTFIVLSAVIALISGMIFDRLVASGTLPENSNRSDLPEDFQFSAELKKQFQQYDFSLANGFSVLRDGVGESKMLLKWIFVGVLIAAAIRAFVPTDSYEQYFGPSTLGILLTVLAATIIEVCSEGSVPIGADLLTRAGAPGNAFTFLMAGVATDYTEIMILREFTKSWKIAFFLPLVVLPQVLLLGILLNYFAA